MPHTKPVLTVLIRCKHSGNVSGCVTDVCPFIKVYVKNDEKVLDREVREQGKISPQAAQEREVWQTRTWPGVSIAPCSFQTIYRKPSIRG